MKIKYYAMQFSVTETLNNGTERKKKVTVNCLPFRHSEDHLSLVHRTQEERINSCIDALKAEHYYNIEYIGTKDTFMMFA